MEEASGLLNNARDGRVRDAMVGDLEESCAQTCLADLSSNCLAGGEIRVEA